MMRKQYIWLICLFCMLFMAGCAGAGDRTSSQPDAAGDSEASERTEHTGETEDEGWVPLVPADASGGGITELKDGFAFGEMERVGTDAPYYCNLEENIAIQGELDVTEQAHSLVCHDPVYDISYYVNRGRDNYIYAIRDGKNMLVVELPATELYCRDGILYFMLKEYQETSLAEALRGCVAGYDPVSGAVRLVSEWQGDSMQVYPDGIVIGRTTGGIAEEESFGTRDTQIRYYSFESQRMEELDPKIIRTDRLRGNYLAYILEKVPEDSERLLALREEGFTGDLYESVGIQLVDASGEVLGVLPGLTSLPSFCRVKNDMLYYTEMREVEGERVLSLMSCPLSTGETSVVFDCAMLGDGNFTIIGDVCYFAGNGYRVSLADGEQNCVSLDLPRNKQEAPAFYTDGERIFLYDGKKLWEYRESRRTDMKPYEMTGALSIPYYRFCYEAELVELGEEYVP